MFKKIRSVNKKEYIDVNEYVAKTSPMMTHYNSPNPLERRLWKQKKKNIKKYFYEIEVNNVIDLGCGDAGILETIPTSVNYHGVDISPTQISYAKKTIKKSGRKNADLSVEDILNLKIKDNSYDAALLCDVVEHVLEPQALLNEAKRIVKKDGYIIISIPNEFLWLLMRAMLLRFPLHSPDHLHEIDPNDIKLNFSKIIKENNIPVSILPKLSLIHLFLIKNDK